MNVKKFLGIACIVIGAICLFFSHYIAERVAAGRLETASGQSQINSTNSLFSTSPYTKPFGNELTSSSQRRVDAGNVEISYYDALAKKFQIGGVILILVGIAILIFWHDKKRR